MKRQKYKTIFVEKMPEKLDEGVLYIVPHYDCAMHKCMCGCEESVCTPLGNEQWHWSYNSESDNATLRPSIGNFSYPCKSHYFLKDGTVLWC